LPQLDEFIERYPGLDVLIEEFEHLSLAREDEDVAAIGYFKREQTLRLEEEKRNSVKQENGDKSADVKEDPEQDQTTIETKVETNGMGMALLLLPNDSEDTTEPL